MPARQQLLYGHTTPHNHTTPDTKPNQVLTNLCISSFVGSVVEREPSWLINELNRSSASPPPPLSSSAPRPRFPAEPRALMLPELDPDMSSPPPTGLQAEAAPLPPPLAPASVAVAPIPANGEGIPAAPNAGGVGAGTGLLQGVGLETSPLGESSLVVIVVSSATSPLMYAALDIRLSRVCVATSAFVSRSEGGARVAGSVGLRSHF